MALVKSLFKNFSYLLLARTAFRFLTALVLIYAANYLGDERYGMLSTATAWANAFLALNDIGMSTLIVREAARDKEKMAVYFGNTLLVEVLGSVILFVLILGIGVGVGYDSTTLMLMAILGAAGLIYEFRKVMRGIFRVLLKLKFVAFLEVVNGALYLLAALWVFAAITDKDLGLLGLAHARLWVNVIIIIALFAYTLKFVRPKFDLGQVIPMVKMSYVFTLYNMFFMLYFQIDQIILSIITDASTVGIYSAPAQIVNVLLFIPLMLFQVTMPVMYRYSEKNPERYKQVNLLTWRYLAAFGIPAGIGISLLSDQIIPLIFRRPEYLGSVPLMSVMGIFLAVRFFGISQGNSLTTTDRQGLRAGIQVVSVAINIVLDIILILKYGAIGAAIATLITETVISSSYIFFSLRYLKERFLPQLLLFAPIAVATAGMSTVVILAKDQLHVMVSVFIGAISYLVLLWISRFFQQEDWRIVKKIVSK